MAQLLSQVAVGSIVKLNESGSPVEFYVSKHDYESGLNGAGRTLLARADVIHNNVQWNSSGINTYDSSTIDNWLNTTYKGRLDSDIQTEIGTTKFYYTPGNRNNTTSTLERSVFALSMIELGRDNSGYYVNTNEGSTLPIASILRTAYSSTPYDQWTRSPMTSSSNNVWGVSGSDGAVNGYSASNSNYGSRPVFTLPGSTTYVLDDGTITLDQPPTAPGSITVPTVAAGQPCAITWTAATDPDGTIASYTLERSVNGSGWTQVFSGNALTYTDTIGSDWGTVAYRVCAVDDAGGSGPYATSETQTVQDGILYISGPVDNLGQRIAPFQFSVQLGISGSSTTTSGIELQVELDSETIYQETVSTGSPVTITIDPRVLSSGVHSINVSATLSDYVPAFHSYNFDTETILLPDGGLGVQLQDESTRPIFPQTVASMVGGMKGTVADDIEGLKDDVRTLDNKLLLIMQNVAEITLTVQNEEGNPLEGIEVSNVFGEDGSPVLTNANGQITGYVSEGNVTLSISGYADVQNYSEQFPAVKGETYTKSITVATRNFLKVTTTQNLRFSANVTRVDVTAVGGGGGGGYGWSQAYNFSGIIYNGGGGGGGYCSTSEDVSFTPNNYYSAIVAGGGAGGTFQSSQGGSGGASSFLGVSANGGGGGATGGITTVAQGNGNGGAPTQTTSTSNIIGGNGVAGSVAGYTSFTETTVYGGGGGAGSLGQSPSTGGAGAGYGGNGGYGATLPTAGQNGFGGGGGGGLAYIMAQVGQASGSDGASGGSGCIAIRMHLASAA